MTFLSCDRSPLENFKLLSNNISSVTEGCDRVFKKIDNEEIPAKKTALIIATIAITVFGILTAVLTKCIPAALIVTGLAAVPFISYRYYVEREKLLNQELYGVAYDLNIIFCNIKEHLETLQNNKEDELINAFNRYGNNFYDNYKKEDAKKQLNNFEAKYNADSLSSSTPERKEYIEWMPFALTLLKREMPHPYLQRFNHKGLQHLDWGSLQKSCIYFLYGKNTSISTMGNGTYTCSRASQINSYLNLEMDSKQSNLWVAKKY